MFAILVLLVIPISSCPTTFPTSPSPASCTSVTFTAPDPCLTLSCCLHQSTIHSKLDYCTSLSLNLDSTQIQRLQVIQNSLARAVTRTPRHHHITPVLKLLHWLKIPEHIQFKVLSLTYNSL